MDSTEPNKTKKTELTELLLDMEKPAGHVIYVVGESGIGKRHLVKKVYEDKAINEKFTVRIWENFSRNSSSRSIADKIVGKLETEWKKMQAEDHNSTYLVVVHCPMSSPTLGDSIVEKFPKGAKGSKIVVATTSSPPKEHDGGIVKLGYLDKTASRTLFNKSLGLEGRRLSVYSTETRENLDETIQVATNGLPLLVILIGKLIRTMTYNKWDAVCEYISNNNQDDYIKTIVSIGMDDLPNDLKSCLLYMAGFPDRSTIDAGQLVRLWIAEGFLTQDLDFEPEELGQRYLKELIFRGLVELVDKNEGNVESVTIRDQIHPFFRSEAQRTGFMETYYGQSAAVPGNARRLALNSTKLPKPDNMKVLHKLRTLLLSHDGSQSFKEAFTHLLTHSTFLRVVSLEGIDIGEELPREIRNMLHLQYLGIRCPTLTTLPNSIRKLKQLQIMDVRGTKVTTLPYSFWNMKSKPHVICDKYLGCPEGAEDRMLIITPATSSSKHT